LEYSSNGESDYAPVLKFCPEIFGSLQIFLEERHSPRRKEKLSPRMGRGWVEMGGVARESPPVR
jgi:hypothetical protein